MLCVPRIVEPVGLRKLRRPRRSRAWLVLGTLLLAWAALWLWQVAARWRAPDQHRSELYRRTLEIVRSQCDPVRPSLESYCRDQADLLLRYPECDAECVALARKVRREPAR